MRGKGIAGGAGRRGSVLTFLLLSIVVVAGGVAGLLSVERARQNRVLDQARAKRALNLAESTVDEAAVLLNAGTLGETGSLDWSDDAADNDGDGLTDEGDEQVGATLVSWRTDGVDNDGDGQTDETDEAVVRVSSTATVGGVTRAMTGWLQRSAATLPDPSGTVWLDDPNAVTNFQGNAFLISGNDVNLDGTAGPKPALKGITINGDPALVTSQLSAQQLDNVVGQGGIPSVGSYVPSNPNEIYDVIAALSPNAGIVFNNYGGTYTGNLGNHSTGTYVITKSNGNLQIGGGGTGAGILLVEGNLTITGGWDYVGYVFVTGKAEMKGGGGTKRIRGALFVGGDVIQQSTVDLWVNGTIDLLYSSQALDLVRNAFGSYTVSAVTEP